LIENACWRNGDGVRATGAALIFGADVTGNPGGRRFPPAPNRAHRFHPYCWISVDLLHRSATPAEQIPALAI
jgi:hypothetical protein